MLPIMSLGLRFDEEYTGVWSVNRWYSWTRSDWHWVFRVADAVVVVRL